MSRVALALDVPDVASAVRWVERTADRVEVYKVGLELFCAEGPAAIGAVRAAGARQVFLDLKLHDIPNTVAGAVRALRRLGVDFVTVHAAGGAAMLSAALEAAGQETTLLGVTVLTSLPSTPDQVVAAAREAVSAGLPGLVCSAQEVGFVRKAVGPDVTLVTPGIRLGAGDHDQARPATPAAAVAAGADLLVVGRAVTAAGDPDAALAEIRAAL